MSRRDPHFKASCPLQPMTTIQVVSMASFNKLSQVLSGGRHRLACVEQSLQSMAFKAYTQWLSRALQGLPHCDTLRRALRSRTPRPFPTQAQPLLMPGEVAPPPLPPAGGGAPRPRPCRLRTRGAAVTGARRHWRASAGRPAQRLRGRVQRCPPRPHTPSTLS